MFAGSRFLWLAVSLSLGLAAGVAATACSTCGDGKVLVDGICVPRCSDEACAEGLACVHAVCRPRCERDSECKGQDICERIVTDEGKRGKYCYGAAVDPSPYGNPSVAPSRPTASMGETSEQPSCETSEDCDQTVQSYCIAAQCQVACTLHEHCGSAGACTGSGQTAEGNMVAYCEADDFPRGPGQYGSKCLTSTSSCDTAAGFQCITAGDGDVGSYCTASGCDADDDCPSGSFCSENRVTSRQPCEAACGLSGSSDARCVPPDAIGPGKPFRCGAAGGLVLALCLERAFCSDCETDADCRGEPNQVCARGPDGRKTCTVLCAANQGSCPWGSATECAVFDEELGKPTCAHRFGACKGTGKSCEPCRDDADCPTGFCAKSDFTGELFCYDAQVSCSCSPGDDICVGGGCPPTPSGRAMNCISTGDGAAPSACYGAEIDTASGAPLGCW